MGTEQLLLIGGLAILDTLSPTTIGVTIYLLLTDKERLTKRLFVYLLTVAGFYFAVGVSLMLGLDFLFKFISGLLQNRIVSWSFFIIGVILFIASFYIPPKKNSEIPLPKSKNIFSMIALGFTTTLIEVGTAFPYFAAIGILTTSNLSLIQWSSILAGYNLIMVLPSLLLFLFYLLFGRWMQKPLERLRMKIANSTGSVLSWIMCIVGFLLILNSLDYL
ncbi:MULTISPECIES: GAP family protein [unclassified Bacillus cereus group]|uniref:GAP family protein n=1 Tax=unclassified Bacillus cereus group TaxID=2750818 RepID=UPI0024C9CBBE|nr:MAG: GAP family protein [Bacillus paranthracis]WAI30093.1 MAG: GAP family protein [Bacillus paranthracis]WAI36622.1 MAG: GAP family protein [Bacillus paranthracis]